MARDDAAKANTAGGDSKHGGTSPRGRRGAAR